MSEYAPLQIQYLGRGRGLGGYIPKVSDPLFGPLAQSLFDTDNNGLSIGDPAKNAFVKQTVTPTQNFFNRVKYVGRSWGTPYAAWAENMMSAFYEKGNYKGEVQNPLNAMLSIVIKNEKIDKDILIEKYGRYLTSMDNEVGGIVNDWKSKYKKSSEKIDVINAQYEGGKIKDVSNRDKQIKDIQDEYSSLAVSLQGQMLEIVGDSKEPMEMLRRLQGLREKTAKQTGVTKSSAEEASTSPLVKASAEAVNNAINSASDIANKALSSLGKTASETVSAISDVKDKISSNITKASVGSVGSAFDVVNKISAAASEASAKIEDVVMGVKEKISSATEPIIKDVKQVADNPDLVLAAYQRWRDKSDESGTTKNKIILPKNIDVTKTPEFSLTGGLPYVGSDTTNLGKMRNSDSEYLSVSSIVDLNKANVGFRNRGDYKEGQGNLQANLLVPFEKPTNLSNNKMYIGIKDGKVVTGRANEIKGADVVSATPFAQVVNITDKYINQENYKFPVLETLGDNQEKKLNISLSKDGKDNVNNKFAGGAVIIETPDKSQKYIVRGSLQQIKTAFDELKQNTNNKYLNMYIMDNGSFSTGLNTKDGKSSKEELKAYESKNVSGGHGIYLK
jgi:soluble cytochrome b562